MNDGVLTMPQMPTMPTMPSMPQIPSLPRIPYMPSVPNTFNIRNLGSFNNAIDQLIEQNNYVNPYDDPNRFRSLADVTHNRKLIRETNDTLNFFESVGDWVSDNIIRNIPIIGGFLEDVVDGTVDVVQDTYDAIKEVPFFGDIVELTEDYGWRWAIGAPERLIKYVDMNYIHPTEGTNPFLNALNALGKDLDFYTLSNLVKSIVIPMTQGDFDIIGNWAKGIGATKDQGITHYNWDTGNWILDLGLEIVSDPSNWITLGGKSLILNPLAELGSESIENVTKQGIKNLTGLSDEVTERILKEMPESAIKSKVLKKQLVRNISEKGLEEAYTEYYEAVLKDVINYTTSNPSLAKAIAKNAFEESAETGVRYMSVLQLKAALNGNLGEATKELVENAIKDYSRQAARQMFTEAGLGSIKWAPNRATKFLLNKNTDIFRLVDKVNNLNKFNDTIPKIVYWTNPASFPIMGAIKLNQKYHFISYLRNKIARWKAAGFTADDVASEFSDYAGSAYRYKDGILMKSTPQETIIKAAEPVVYRDIARLPSAWQAKGMTTNGLYKAYIRAANRAILKPSYKLGIQNTKEVIYNYFLDNIQRDYGITIDAMDKEILLQYLNNNILPDIIKDPQLLSTAKALKSIVDKLDSMKSIAQFETEATKRTLRKNFSKLKSDLNKLPNNYQRLLRLRTAFFDYNVGGKNKYFKLQNYRRILTNANPAAADTAIAEFEKLMKDMRIDIKDLPKYDLLLDLHISDQDKIKKFFELTSLTEQESLFKDFDNHTRRILRDKNRPIFSSVFQPSKIRYARQPKIKKVPIIYTDLNQIDKILDGIPKNLLNIPQGTIKSKNLYVTIDMISAGPFDVANKEYFIEVLKDSATIISNINKELDGFFDGLDKGYIYNLLPSLKEYYTETAGVINEHVANNLEILDAFEEVFIKDLYENMYLKKSSGYYSELGPNDITTIERIVEDFNNVINEIYKDALNTRNNSFGTALSDSDYKPGAYKAPSKYLRDTKGRFRREKAWEKWDSVEDITSSKIDLIENKKAVMFDNNYFNIIEELYDFSRKINKLDLGTQFEKLAENTDKMKGFLLPHRQNYDRYMQNIFDDEPLANAMMDLANEDSPIRLSLAGLLDLLKSDEADATMRDAAGLIQKFISNVEGVVNYASFISDGNIESFYKEGLDKNLVETCRNELLNQLYCATDTAAKLMTEEDILKIRDNISKLFYYPASYGLKDSIRYKELKQVGIENITNADIQQALDDTMFAFRTYLAEQANKNLPLFVFLDKSMLLQIRDLEQYYYDLYDMLYKKIDTKTSDALNAYKDFLNIFSVHDLSSLDYDEIYSKLEAEEYDEVYKHLSKENSLLRTYIDTSKEISAKNEELLQKYGIASDSVVKTFLGDPYLINATLGVGTKNIDETAGKYFSESFVNNMGLPSIYYRKLQDDFNKSIKNTKNFKYSTENELAFKLGLLQKTGDPVFRQAINNGIDAGVDKTIEIIKQAPSEELRSWFYVIKSDESFNELIKNMDSLSNSLDTILSAITEDDLKLLDDKAFYTMRTKLSSLYNNIGFARFATNNNYILDFLTSSENTINTHTITELANLFNEDPTVFMQQINKKLLNDGLEKTKQFVFRKYLNNLPNNYLLALYSTAYNNTDCYETIKKSFKDEASKGKAVEENILPNIEDEKLLETINDLVSSGELHLAIATAKENLYTDRVFGRSVNVLNKNMSYKDFQKLFPNQKINITETEYNKLLKSTELKEAARSNDLTLTRVDDLIKKLEQKDNATLNKVLDYTIKKRLSFILGLSYTDKQGVLHLEDLRDFIIGPNLGLIRIQTTDFNIPWTKADLNKVDLDIYTKDNLTIIYNTNPNVKEIFNNSQKYKKYKTLKPESYLDVYKDLTDFYNTFMPYTNLVDPPFELEFFLPTTLERSMYDAYKQELANFGIQNAYLNDNFFNNDYARIDFVNFTDPGLFKQEHGGLLNMLTNNTTALIKRADTSIKFIDEMFTQECFFPSFIASCMGALSDEEIPKALKELKLSAIVITKRHLKGGVVKLGVKDYKIFNKKQLQELCDSKIPSAIVPSDLVYNIKERIINGVTDNNFMKTLRAYNVLLKTSLMSNPGTAVRNLLDIIFKNTVMTKRGLGEQFFYYGKAMQIWNVYSAIYNEANKIYGGVNDNYLEAAMHAMAQSAGLKKGTRAYDDFIALMNFVKEAVDSGTLDSNVKTLEDLQKRYTLKHTRGYDRVLRIIQGIAQENPYSKGIRKISEFGETTGRLGLGLMNLVDTESLDSALETVAKTHFKYGGKSEAQQFIELIIPFSTFPMKNFVWYWDNMLSFPQILRGLLHAIRSSWSDESGSYGSTIYVDKQGHLRTDPFKLAAVKSGGIKLGDYMFKTGSSFLDYMALMMDPLGELESRLTPAVRFALSNGTDAYSGYAMLPFGTQIYKIEQSVNQIRKGKMGLQTFFPSMIGKQYPNYYSLANKQNKPIRPYYNYPKVNRNPISYGKYPKVSYKAMHGSNRALAFKRYYAKYRYHNIYYDLYKKNKYAIVNLKKWQAQNPSYYWSNTKNIVSNVNRIKSMFR